MGVAGQTTGEYCRVYLELSVGQSLKRPPQRFSSAMVAIGEITDRGLLINSSFWPIKPRYCTHETCSVYPWTNLPADTVICDVAGNNGHATLELAKSFPEFKVVVQDLEKVEPLWDKVCYIWSSIACICCLSLFSSYGLKSFRKQYRTGVPFLFPSILLRMLLWKTVISISFAIACEH